MQRTLAVEMMSGGPKSPFQIALDQVENVIRFKKCHKCGCNQGAIKGLEKELHKISPADRSKLGPLMEKAKQTFLPIEYDCLGCKVCFPGDLGNALSQAYPSLALEPDSCASEDIFVEARAGFPPFPGSFQVIRYQAPVAVCTLNSKDLVAAIARSAHPALSIVGSLNTENLGIERVIRNSLSNPHIRYLILCGEDSEQRIGHLPGQSLLSLSRNGVDSGLRIVGAQGKRPVLKNVGLDEVRQFREQVEVVDMTGEIKPEVVLQMAERLGNQDPGPYQGGVAVQNRMEPIKAEPPQRLTLDPSGYFVIFPVEAESKIVVEHYLNTGVLNRIVEGSDLGSIYMTIIDLGLISRLDHAAYLGKELARAEVSLMKGTAYVQDQAQEARATEAQAPGAEAGSKRCGSGGCC